MPAAMGEVEPVFGVEVDHCLRVDEAEVKDDHTDEFW